MLDSINHPDADAGAASIFTAAGQPPIHLAVPPIEAPRPMSPSIEPHEARAALLVGQRPAPWWVAFFSAFR